MSIEFDDGNDYDDDHHSHMSNLSRLSMSCISTSTTVYGHDDDDDGMKMLMSGLSIHDYQGYGDEDADAEVDEEFNDDDDDDDEEEGKLQISRGLMFWDDDSDKELPLGLGCCYSLLATPPPSRQKGRGGGSQVAVKEYADENETHQRRSRVVGIREMTSNNYSKYSNTNSSGLSVVSGYSTLDNMSSAPINNWRISTPGDDPRDVKARLRVWAQAVALASASMSRHACG